MNITIIGIGLIGASLAKALKSRNSAIHITAYDRPKVLALAIEMALIDKAAQSIEDAVQSAEVVILATPIHSIIDYLAQIAPFLPQNCIVTDVGSVKLPIDKAAKALLPQHVQFVGGHPMAGAEHIGILHADAFLFENATYVLCPATSAEIPQKLLTLIEDTGARILVMDAHRHDKIAACISHLPQLVAVALMNVAAKMNQQDDAFLRLAAGGFRDMTRIASSGFGIWGDILANNQQAVTQMLELLITDLSEIKETITRGASHSLAQDFEKARTVRETIPKNSKGFLKPLADIYVFAEDKPGFLYHLTRILYEQDLNIKDMELLKIREGNGGAFRLSFENDDKAHQAIDLLSKNAYTVYALR